KRFSEMTDNDKENDVKGLPEGTRENDIRHTNEARDLKAMPHMAPDEWEHDYWGYRCPVCGAALRSGEDGDFDPDVRPDPDSEGPYDPDTYVGGVGNYHVAHLSKGEYDYTRSTEQEREADFERAAVAEQQQKMSTALAGEDRKSVV